jgi:hypothetical protein
MMILKNGGNDDEIETRRGANKECGLENFLKKALLVSFSF